MTDIPLNLRCKDKNISLPISKKPNDESLSIITSSAPLQRCNTMIRSPGLDSETQNLMDQLEELKIMMQDKEQLNNHLIGK